MSINVTQPFMPPKKEYRELIDRIWDEKWLTNNGPLLKEFENDLQAYLGVDRLHLTVNGHIALESALAAFHLKGEVLTTPFTFASTTHAIVRQGLTPVFCDIRGDDFTLNADALEAQITEKTCAIVPVHVYGYPCHVEDIERIAKKHNLKVVYDAAHTFGVRYKGKSLCDYGDSAILSFHATKLFHTIEGGAVVSHSEEYAQAVEECKNYGILDEETVVSAGGNAKMNEFQAAMGIVNLRYVEELIAERRVISQYYYKLLEGIPGISFHKAETENIRYNYAYFPIFVDETAYGRNRNELFSKLRESGINARKYFYPITSDFDCYRDRYHSETPIARAASSRVMCLPLYNGLALKDVERICGIIENFKRK